MPNDIAKLRRLMRRANYLRNKTTEYYDRASSLRGAWWFETFRNALNNGFARFTYYKKDGTFRRTLGTRADCLIPLDKIPNTYNSDEIKDSAKTIPYFDLEKNEWRSFNVINFVKLEQVWRFNSPVTLNIDHIND